MGSIRPHLPHAFADGDRVFVMKSRGGQRGAARSPQPSCVARQPRTAGAPSFTRMAAPTRPGRSYWYPSGAAGL